MCNAENKTKYIYFKTKKGVDRKMKVCSAFLVGFKLAVEYFNQITKIKQYAKRRRNQRGFIIGIIFVVFVELVECQREKGAKA